MVFPTSRGNDVPKDIYTDLSKVTSERIGFSSATPFTPRYVKENVTRSSDSDQLYSSRVQRKQIVLDYNSHGSRLTQEEETKRAKRITDKGKAGSNRSTIGKQEAREKGLWKLNKEHAKYEIFLAIHKLWMDYMSELLTLSSAPSVVEDPSHVQAMPNASAMHAKLIKADFHGALISVLRSKNPAVVGLSGIVIHETENVFKIVTAKDQQKLIPKRNSVFTLAVPLHATTSDIPYPNNSVPHNVTQNSSRQTTVLDIPHIELELYGNQFCFRSADRASRKFKHKETIEL